MNDNSNDTTHQTKTTSIQHLSIFAHNVNGLLTKINELYAEVKAANFDIYICLQKQI